ncbi:MAG TPA: tripartite tricarboxylate transporter substrate binding protein, partial [Alphaproteobacteria bacterium]
MARWLAGIGAALVATLALSSSGAAQNYPNRTVKIIVPFPAGGTADAMPRVVADFLSRKWGQAVVIENRAGAGGNVGAEAAFKSDPDGYTLFSAPPPPLVINQNLYPRLNFDPTQFIPIAVMGKVPNALLTNSPRLKDVKTVGEFVAYAKAHPGQLNSGTQGVGTTAHLT